MRYLVSQADNYNIDTAWLFTGGISAGAITAMAINYLDDNIASPSRCQNVPVNWVALAMHPTTFKQLHHKGISSIAGAVMDSSLVHEGRTFQPSFSRAMQMK